MTEVIRARISRALLVIRHAWQMYRNLTLPRNVAKGGWEGMPQLELLDLLQGELTELYAACWELECGKGSAQRVVEEAADVSAYAAMLSGTAKKRGRK